MEEGVALRKNTHRTSSLCWGSTEQPKEKLRFVQCAAENEKKKRLLLAPMRGGGDGRNASPRD